MDGAHDGPYAEAQLMDGAQIPLDAADGQPPLFPQRGDQAEHVDAQALLAQDHAVQLGWGQTATPTPGVDPGHIDVLGDLRRNHRQLDDLPSALDPAAGQVGAAIGTVLHHVLHPVGGCHARAGEAVASLLAGLLLRRWLAARTGLEAGHSGWATRFGLAFQFGNPPLQPLNHPLLFQNGGLQLGDDGDKDSAVGGGEINFSIHDPVYDITTATRASLRQPAFGQFNSSSLNCYALLHYLTRHYPELSCLQIALCQLMPVNVPGVNQALELMVVSNAGDGGMGRSARILR